MAAATLDFNSKLKLTNETPYTFLTSHVKPDRLLVVLDLDKTLIHSELHDVGTKDDCSFVITNSELREMGFDPGCKENHVWMRPGVAQFIERASQVADVIVWTLSDPSLAQSVIRRFDGTRSRGVSYLKGIIGRDAFNHVGVNFHDTTLSKKGQRYTVNPRRMLPPLVMELLGRMDSVVNMPHYIKDLSILGHTLARTLIVEDWPDLCALNPDNAIIVPDFNKPSEDVNSANDKELLTYVLPIIESLAEKLGRREISDVRHMLANYSGVRKTVTRLFASPDTYSLMLSDHQNMCRNERPWAFEAAPLALKHMDVPDEKEVDDDFSDYESGEDDGEDRTLTTNHTNSPRKATRSGVGSPKRRILFSSA